MTDERYEIVEFSSHIPIKIFMHKLGSVTRHWHRSLELLLVLEGEVEISMDGETSHLKSEDIILINSNTIHDIYSNYAVMIALQFKLEMFAPLYNDIDNLLFECNSSKDSNKERYSGIQFSIARMIKENMYRSDGTDYKNLSLSYYLISELLDYFRVPSTDAIQKKRKHTARLTRIVNYINQHYKENFSLSDLAESEQLSVPYLSNFFDKHLGIKFSQYYMNVKLDHAVKDLLNTNDTIETVALNNGFTEYHAFIRSFKKKYNMLPSTYRKEMLKKITKKTTSSNFNYLLVEPSKYLHLLTKYLPNNELSFHDRPKSISESIVINNISVSEVKKKLKHTFKNFISVGRAKELLNHDIQNMLRDIQENIGYKYIKFHGILSDDMMVCFRSGDTLNFRYTFTDMALDFLLSIGLKPMIQLSFMPKALASNPDKTVCESPFNTSPPKDIKEWNMLVDDFTRHLISRYGKAEVESWPFCVWNEPSTSKSMFGFGDNLLFFDFYKNTFNTVKEINPTIQFGSPSILSLENDSPTKWENLFIKWIQKNDCVPDFMNIHYYSDIIPEKTDGFFLNQATISMFPKNTDDFKIFIDRMKKTFQNLGVGDKPVYLTEWNFTLSHRNLINDTCFKACYILKNLLENYDKLDSFGYWCLTDLLEENTLPDTLFHGGLGLYTMNGLRKSTFYAFYFANLLGNELLSSGEGYYVTKKENCYQIITYNYIHYGDLFASGELFDITETQRYSPFNMANAAEYKIELKDLEPGCYEVKEYFVNRNHGSAFDIWVGFGGLPLNPKDTELLKGLCVPGFHLKKKQTLDGSLDYNATLEPLEIRFAEIRLV